jgi:septum formation protein
MSLQAEAPLLVLASASSARKAVLSAAGLRFEAVAAFIDEDDIKRGAKAEGISAGDTAVLLAEMKAARIARTRPDALVIGCDQLLVCNGAWFDKPVDLVAASKQLKALRGQTHTLETAVVCLRGGRTIWHHIARPRLTMRSFSDAFLAEYLESEQDFVTSSVGAYRLEGLGIQLFDKVEGEHAAILGLPLLALLGFLRQHGVLAS